MDQQSSLFDNKNTKPSRRYKSKIKIGLIVQNIALSSFYFGYCMVYLGSIPITSIQIIFNISLDSGVTQGILNGCIPIGGLLGALASSLIISNFSRRNCFLLMDFIAMAVGALIYIPNFYTLIIFRVGQGFCVGVFSALTSMVIKQLSPKQISGTLGTFMQLNVGIGTFMGYFINYCLKKITGDLTCMNFWQIIFGVPFITLFTQTIVLIFVFPYETPKYLLLKGDQSRARQLIQVIYKQNYIDEVLQQKKKDIIGYQEVTSNCIDSSILTEKDQHQQKNLKPKIQLTTILGLHLAIMQQFSGVNAVSIYCNPIINKTTSGQLALIMSSLMILEKVIMTFATSFLLVRFGRKFILDLGVACEGIACGMIAIGFFLKESEPSLSQILIIVGLFLFMAVFGVSLGPVVWLYIAEIVQPKIIPFTTTANWIAASLVIILFPILTDNILSGNPAILFLFFTLWCFASLAFNIFFLIQTKDKTEKQIRDQFMALKSK